MSPPEVVTQTPRGRDETIRTLDRLLETDEARIITLSGLAGVGKTHIARFVVDRRTTSGAGIRATGEPPELVWVDAASATHFDHLLEAVGLEDGGGQSVAVVAAALDAIPRLIVVDAADTIADPNRTLGALMSETVTTQWLVTSRAPLRVDSECVVRVGALPAREPGSDQLSARSDPRVQIFFDVAAQYGRHLPTDGATLGEVAAIVDHLGGLPGAIELAASRLTALSPATIRGLLERSTVSEIMVGNRDAAALFAAVGWSVSLLDAEQQRLLLQMTVFRGPVPIEAISAVTGVAIDELVDLITELIDLHLLDARHDDPFSVFSLNPIVREYARSELPADDQNDDDHDDVDLPARHQKWAVGVAAGIDRTGVPDPVVVTLEPDLVAALHCALESDSADAAAAIAVALAPLWLLRGVRAHHVDTMSDVSDIVVGHRTDAELAAPVLAWTSLFRSDRTVSRDDVQEVVECRDAAVALCRQGSEPMQLAVLDLAVRTARILDERGVALALCSEGLELARRLADERSLARFEVWSGMLAHQDHRLDDAARMGRSALDRARRLDDRWLIVSAAFLLRTLPVPIDPSVPVPPAAELTAMAEQCGDRRSLTWLRPAAAAEAMRLGDVRGAAAFTVAAVSAARSQAAWGAAAIAMVNVPRIAASTGDAALAARFHGMLAAQWPVLRRSLPPAFAEAHEAFVGRLRDALGDERFEQSVGSGAMLPFTEATGEAVRFAQSLVVAAEATDDDSGSRNATPLTPREEQIIGRMVDGETNKQIAIEFGITPKTVMHHTSSIYRKLGVRGRAEAVAWAVRRRA